MVVGKAAYILEIEYIMAIGINKKYWEKIGEAAGWRKTPVQVKLAQSEISKNINDFYASTQDFDTNEPNFAVDIRRDTISIPNGVRVKINNALSDLGNYHKNIPIQEIIRILHSNGVIMLQEDGTHWEGFVLPTGQCGAVDDSGKSKNSPFHFDLAFKSSGNARYLPCENNLVMSACTMPSGNIEIVTYIS